jgi:hypothetical protein
MIAITKAELDSLERDTREYLKLMKQGNYADARSISNMLVHATYTLDAVWMKAYEARMKKI